MCVFTQKAGPSQGPTPHMQYNSQTLAYFACFWSSRPQMMCVMPSCQLDARRAPEAAAKLRKASRPGPSSPDASNTQFCRPPRHRTGADLALASEPAGNTMTSTLFTQLSSHIGLRPLQPLLPSGGKRACAQYLFGKRASITMHGRNISVQDLETQISLRGDALYE